MQKIPANDRPVTLAVLAAGIGSRFGGIKQLEPVGPGGEILMDYSIHDAVAAGFNKIIWIISRAIYDDFREMIGKRLETQLQALGVAWAYVFQELTDPPAGRTKPWGTGQAVMACRDVIREPFAVINADDYYGRDAFAQACEFLKTCDADSPKAYGMIGYVLKNTLSDNGSVTRGVCTVDGGRLVGIDETRNIIKTPNGAAAQEETGLRALDGDGLVSMNFWMLPPAFIARLEEGFPRFRQQMQDPQKDEYLLPSIVDELLRQELAEVTVLPSADSWFGVTYREDLPPVKEAFGELYARGVYQRELYADLQ